jgi:hypothetical protein
MSRGRERADESGIPLDSMNRRVHFRYKDIKAAVSRIDGRIQYISASSSNAAPENKDGEQQSKRPGIGSKTSIKSPFKLSKGGWSSLDHQSSIIRHSHTAEALNQMTQKELMDLNMEDTKEAALTGDRNRDGKINDADLNYVANFKQETEHTLYSVMKVTAPS